jgi:hypothetical protein
MSLHKSQGVGSSGKGSGGKSPPSSLLRRGFLLPSALGVAPYLSPKDGVEGVPSLLDGCVTPTVENGVDVRLNGLIQSRSGR